MIYVIQSHNVSESEMSSVSNLFSLSAGRLFQLVSDPGFRASFPMLSHPAFRLYAPLSDFSGLGLLGLQGGLTSHPQLGAFPGILPYTLVQKVA